MRTGDTASQHASTFSPPLPLIVDHIDEEYRVLAPEEEGIILALQHRDRVRRIRVRKPLSTLQRLIVALDGDFPILEYLSIDERRFTRPLVDHITSLNLPETFRAPHLRQLVLDNFVTSIKSLPLITTGNLVTLILTSIPSFGYFHPNVLLQQLSLMPYLETLAIIFNCYNSSRDVEGHLFRPPVMVQVTLPNLRCLKFEGTNAYLETLLPWVTIPLLERFYTHLFNRMMYSIPHLRRFLSNLGNLRLKTATVTFEADYLNMVAYAHEGERLYTLPIGLGGKHFDWQVVSAAQVLHAFKAVFSTVEYLTLDYDRHNISSEWNGQANHTHWRELLGSFENVRTLQVEYGLVEQVSCALQPGEGESPTGLFPELQELAYAYESHSRRAALRAFTPFIDARQKAGRPVTVNDFVKR